MCLFDIKIVNYKKVEKINLLGALVTISFYIIAIFIFSLRIFGRPQYGHYLGYFLLILIIPLFYLLVKAPYFNRPFIYYIQMIVMISLIIELTLDYLLKINFRQIRWMAMSYFILFFTASGAMLGIASLAGKKWTLLAIILFWIMSILAFLQLDWFVNQNFSFKFHFFLNMLNMI